MARTTRRDVLRRAFLAMGALGSSAAIIRIAVGRSADEAGGDFPSYNPPAIDPPRRSRIADLGPLGEPDEMGLRLPKGFRARIVARSSQPVGPSGHRWHPAPDGGATFLAEDGGYVYVSNAESLFDGGAGALAFDAQGKLLRGYRILEGTTVNCAGGATPWGTWLSCEERSQGLTWECDPFGRQAAVVRPALGAFKHEAVAVDPKRHQLYLTEDVADGRLYRFTPKRVVAGRPDLSAGQLHVMQVTGRLEGAVAWHELADPSGARVETRYQVQASTPFNGGEGIDWHDDVVFFATKGDNRVWAYDVAAETLRILYDDDRSRTPILTGVDNVAITPAGDVMVAEDQGNMQLIAITPDGQLVPLVHVTGQDRSEITGPALCPYRRRLYFSSQRGARGDALGEHGITYEVTGPFFS
jgi:uncharacterized protein